MRAQEEAVVAGRPVPDRVWTVPNALSALRLLGVPAFLWLVLARLDGWALAVLALAGASDYLDGKIARRFGLESRLGQVLDPAADRLYILATLLGLAWREVVPWWLVALLLAREAVGGACVLVVRRYGYRALPVHFIGKAATFDLLYAFPLLLLAEAGGLLGTVALVAGWAFAWWGTGLYWVAGGMYVAQTVAVVRSHRAGPAAGALG